MANKGQIGLEVKEGKFLLVHSITRGAIELKYGQTKGARSSALHVNPYLAQLP
jgi:hypothetical protein